MHKVSMFHKHTVHFLQMTGLVGIKIMTGKEQSLTVCPSNTSCTGMYICNTNNLGNRLL